MSDWVSNEIIEKTIAKHGKTVQTVVCMEECSELIKECSKMVRKEGNIDHLIEEMADVHICLDMLELMYDIDHGDVLTEMVKKFDRLQKRLEETPDDAS